MNKLEQLVQGKVFKKFLTRLYGIGASIVVVGALFKIEHWPGASIMLSTGLFTEAIIFFFFAFDSQPEEPDHQGEGAGEGAAHGIGHGAAHGQGGNGGYGGYGGYSAIIPQEGVAGMPAGGPPGLYFSGGEPVRVGYGQGAQMGEGVIPPVRGSAIALTRLDDLLMQADISPDLLSELGRGLHKLGVSLSNMEAVGNVSEASQSYVETIRAADESLERLSKTYEEAITKVTEKTLFKYRGVAKSLSVIEKEASTYRDEMSNLNTMLGKLNTVYAQQRREENDYLRELVVAALESKKYRQQVAELNEHLAALNRHYAGMARELKTKRS
ncbi:MAG: hypothetical protein GX619_04195 [Bacteroidales bacterium]|nr:hypothetical protein [Bacteroidales bacterium]